jgi:peptidyl-dipeptidase A
MGELFFTAATQPEYLQMLGLSLPRREETLHIPNASDKTIDLNLLAILLRQAYNDITAPINLPFFAGVVPQFERELYESDTLKPEDYNKHWYKLVAKYQGISPPQERPMEGFDAITKGHLIQAPASYYKYAFATVLRYQLHQYICTNILHSKDLHHCNYQGNQEVGDYLKMVMVESALHPFTEVVEKTTGHPLSSDGMIAYFQPLQDWLEIQNQGNQCEFGSSLASQLDRKSEGGLK